MYQQAETIEAIAEGSRLHGGGNVLLVVRLYLQSISPAFDRPSTGKVDLRIYGLSAADSI